MIKSSADRGGITENVFLRNIEVGEARKEVVIAIMHYKNDTSAYMPTIRNIQIRYMKVRRGEIGVFLDSPIQNFSMSEVEINDVKETYKFVHATDVKFTNVTINGKSPTNNRNEKLYSNLSFQVITGE